ncbi:ATP-binding protein [Massilia eurypsychrophila]|uniref:ATP-binding protein n=1 Tax=Massilia eurypsychrophila TaxID=1485217 RepID=UPI001C557937
MGAIDGMTRSDLLEIIDDRAGSAATIITSQLKCGAPYFSCNAEFNLTRSSVSGTRHPSHS